MKDSPESTALANEAWGRVVSKALADVGVKSVVFSPGSRSTPLILGCEAQESHEPPLSLPLV
jgi:2-succinyl-5-enolpyruvyl-6-hydroxy-3-cyclohexene-1-carboxylate synthase